MSCPDEQTYLIWLDGELPSGARRPVEAHLVQCKACRARVLALRDEADLLRDVLLDREPPSLPHAPPAAPARGFALGLVPAVALVSLVLAGAGWIAESLPASVDWMNPLQIKGATEMLFKVIFLARDEAPALLQLGMAVAATASLSAVLTFAVTAVFRRAGHRGAVGLALLALFAAPAPSDAHFGMHHHEDFALAAGETHDGTLIVSGGTVSIDGVVAGDLLVLAERLSLRGEVRGNVFALSETIELGGVVTGSAHVGGDRVSITGQVEGHLYTASEQLGIAPSGRVAGDVLAWTADGVVEGAVGRDLYCVGKRLEVRGNIERNLFAKRIHLVLRDGARIGGDVDAWLRSGDQIDASPGAEIAGEVRTEELPSTRQLLMKRYGTAAFYVLLVLQFVAAFLVGMLLHAAAPRAFDGRLETSGDFFRSLGAGFVALIATPIVLLVTAFTLVGIPLALIGFALYCAAVYSSAILVGALVGAALIRRRGSDEPQFGLALLAGLAVVMLLAHLPILGWPVHVVVVLVGMGLWVECGRVAWVARRLAR